jgi:hypothetical protein
VSSRRKMELSQPSSEATGEGKTGGANKRGGATMAIYIPPGRNRPPDSAVIWTILLALLAPVLAGSAMRPETGDQLFPDPDS